MNGQGPKLHKSDDFTQGNGSVILGIVIGSAISLVCIVAAMMLVLTVVKP